MKNVDTFLIFFFAGNGTFRFKRLPFGLCNSPDIFQELLLTVVLADCPGTLNYLDDILVYGSSKDEHDLNLKITLEKLRYHNVRLNTNKCIFGAKTVNFLGFNLSGDGLRVDEDKRKAIENFRKPETLAEVKSFLGLMNFTERFVCGRNACENSHADVSESTSGLQFDLTVYCDNHSLNMACTEYTLNDMQFVSGVVH